MESFSSFGLILASVITLLCFVHSQTMKKVPQSVPWAGLRKEVLPKTRANLRELMAGLRTLRIGYNQVCPNLPIILALITASICSSIERVYLGSVRILDFVPL